jgi:gliding motility-associated-like protein
VDKLSSTPIGANANPQVVIIGNSTTLSYTGDLGATLTWYPANLVKGINGYTASASPDKRTTYTVVAKRGACVESVEVVVDAYTDGCLDNDTFIPNTFTPNGDGQNDVLFVRGLKITDLYFAVYNRWGEPVFETKDKNQGWDGKYKGKPAEPGVYGWYIKVTCITGKDAFKKGNVTLLR